jgi:hypothetical protein
MIINLWSTPRSGSNWYADFLLNEQKKVNPKTIKIKHYLNYYHLINYDKAGHSDWLYEYTPGLRYPAYYYDPLRQSIKQDVVNGERTRTVEQEEEYRISLFEKHNHIKNPVVMHSHFAPMSKRGYDYLFKKADKNIFLYRENFVDQMSSYALAYGTNIWKPRANLPVFENIDADEGVLKHLYERILLWHKIDKQGCEIVKYEDFDFNYQGAGMPVKQNKTNTFDQLSKKTQNTILYFEKELKRNL